MSQPRLGPTPSMPSFVLPAALGRSSTILPLAVPVCRTKPISAARNRPLPSPHVVRAVAVDPPSTLTDELQRDLSSGALRAAIARVEAAVSLQTDAAAPVTTYRYLHDLLFRSSQMREWEVALRTFHAMERTGLFCVRSTSSHLFNALCRAARISEAVAVLDVLWNPYITLFDGSERALEERQLARRIPDEKMVTQIANAAVQVGRPEAAIQAVRDMESHGVRGTIFTISVLIKAYGRQGNAEAVTRVLGGLNRRDLTPDVIVFNTAIEAYIRCGEKTMAAQTLREIGRRGLTPSTRSFNPILRDLARCGKLAEALALSREMEKRGIRPSPRTYNALIHAYVKAKEWDKAGELLIESSAVAEEEMQSAAHRRKRERFGRRGEAASRLMSKDVAVGYTTIISGLAVNWDVKGAIRLLEKMVQQIEDTGKTQELEAEIGVAVTSILSALLGQDEVVRAWTLFRSIRKRFKIRLPPDTYNAVIRGLSRRGDAVSMEAAGQVFDEMLRVFGKQRRRGRRGGEGGVGGAGAREATAEDMTLAYNSMIDGFVRCGDTLAGERLLDEMEDAGHVATVVTYTTLMGGYGREVDVVSTRRVFRRMRAAGVAADRVAMNAFIGACVRAGDMELAVRLFEEMQRVGGAISPNLVTFSAVIAGFVRERRVNEAWEAYEEMKGVGIVPNERLLERMMAAFVAPELKPGRGEVRKVDGVEEGVDGRLGEVLQGGCVQGGVVDEEVVVRRVEERGGWASKRAVVLLEDMENCKCSEVNKRRWRRAIESVWSF